MTWVQAGNRWINLDHVREVYQSDQESVRVIYSDGRDLVLTGENMREFLEGFQDHLFRQAEQELNPDNEVRFDVSSRDEYDHRYRSQ